ncbi:hypothetical protein CEE69_05435 [Rhodopirellula bahusiensis]|uniref:Uncharacterized protein n=1 Tax=Rhodopirellula bahusiensis TaxID=2014065 RepID=A0A2G1WAQ6_9BACT|nr:hypothetical protein CEE69_05435 [Rhodopirellula bahusiensis]
MNDQWELLPFPDLAHPVDWFDVECHFVSVFLSIGRFLTKPFRFFEEVMMLGFRTGPSCGVSA